MAMEPPPSPNAMLSRKQTPQSSPIPMSPSTPSTPTSSTFSMMPPLSRKRTNESPPPCSRTPPQKRRRTSSSFGDAHSKPVFHLLCLITPRGGSPKAKVLGTFLTGGEARRAGREFVEERMGDADMSDGDGDGDGADGEDGDGIVGVSESGKRLDQWKLEVTLNGTEYKLSIQPHNMPSEVVPPRVFAVTKSVYDMEECLVSQEVICLYRERERANARARQVLRESTGQPYQVTRRRKSLGGKNGVEYEESMDSKGWYTGCVYLKGQGRHRVVVKTEGWELC